MTTLGDSGWGPMATLGELNAPRCPDLHSPPELWALLGQHSERDLPSSFHCLTSHFLPGTPIWPPAAGRGVGGVPQKLFQEKSPLTSHLQAQGTLRVTLPTLPFS